MKNCLLTELKNTVEDNELLKLGEIRAKYVSNSTNNNINSINSQEVQIISGNAHFSESEDTIIQLRPKVYTSLNMTDNSQVGSIISIPDKYSLTQLRLNGYTLYPEQIKYLNNLLQLHFDSESDYDLSFLSSFKNQLTFLTFGTKSKASGDVKHIVNALKQTEQNNVYFNFSVAQQNIEGDVSIFNSIASSLIGCPYFYYTSMHGDISGILNSCNTQLSANCTNANIIVDFDVYNIKPTEPKLYYSRGLVKGDISKMSPLAYGLHGRIGSKCGWSNSSGRSADSYIIGMDYPIDFGNDLDNMLINQAKCKVYENAEECILTINALGNRTTASDAAIQTLKSKGITVNVPSAIS